MSRRARRRRTRKLRRVTRAVLNFGPSARPAHKSPSGRTGSVHAKKLKSRKSV